MFLIFRADVQKTRIQIETLEDFLVYFKFTNRKVALDSVCLEA